MHKPQAALHARSMKFGLSPHSPLLAHSVHLACSYASNFFDEQGHGRKGAVNWDRPKRDFKTWRAVREPKREKGSSSDSARPLEGS